MAFSAGLFTFLLSLAPPATPTAPKVAIFVIESVTGLVSAVITHYTSVRDDVLNNIRKIREISIVDLRKWPEGVIGYTGS